MVYLLLQQVHSYYYFKFHTTTHCATAALTAVSSTKLIEI